MTGQTAAWYEPGERWLIVAGAAMVVTDGPSSEALDVWRAASAGVDAAALLTACVRPALESGRWSDPRMFALAAAEPGGVRVIVRGVDDVIVRSADGSDTAVAASGLLTWAEAFVADAVEVRVGSGEDAVLPVPVGVVRAGALRWEVPDTAWAQSPRQAEPVSSPKGGHISLDVPLPDLFVSEVPSPSSESGPSSPAVAISDAPIDAIPEVAVDAIPEIPVDALPDFPLDEMDGTPYGGDHDGLTQLAEDLPIGYTPPPLPSAPPPGSVLAALCPAGHPNAPHSRSCRLCGQLITEGTPVAVPRPVLARIRLSTGDLIDVDRAVVIGRSPYVSRVAATDLPRLVAVPSPNQDISRAHVEIRPADWHLVVADLDSTNGTMVRAPGRPPQRLRPGQEVVVEPGWTVELGDGVGFAVEAV
jgi:hypothetical protein